VTDFDHTLTRRQFPENKQGDSTFKVIHTWSGTPADVRKKCTDLYLHYYPMESDAMLPHETKLKMIDEWF
jgi:hypothetical protein